MALTTTNMSLRAWDQISDFFQHADLLSNWQAIDAHDHTAGKGAVIPSGGIASAAITNTKLGPAAVTGDKIDSSAITDSHLNRTAVAQYRTVLARSFIFVQGTHTAGTRYIATPHTPTVSSTSLVEGAAGSWYGAFYLNPFDHYLGSYTTSSGYYTGSHSSRYKLQAQWWANNLAPASSTITVDLRNGVTNNTPSTGNPTIASAGSQATLVLNIPATPLTIGNAQSSTDFAIANPDYFYVGVTASALSLNSQIGVQVLLQSTNI